MRAWQYVRLVPSPATWLAVVQVVVAVPAVGFALVRRREPTSTLAWILAILLVPIVGGLAYFALANPYVARPRRRRRDAAARTRAQNPVHAHDDTCVDERAVRSLLEGCHRLTGLPATHGNRVTLFPGTADAEAARLAAVAAASRSVWAEYYIVHGDDAGRRFLSLLVQRAHEGLDVRLLVDAVGSSDIDRASVAALRAAGGHVAVFHPVNPFRRRWAVHLRNHRKVLVLDGEAAFVGGMNIGDNYAARRRKMPVPFRDTMMRVEGPGAADLARVFAEDWCFMRGEALPLPAEEPHPGHSTVAILPSGPDQPHNATAFAWFAAVGLALERCWLTTPYLVPDAAMLAALTHAARRGVDVRILVPRRADFWLMDLVNRSYYPALLASGARVFEYAPSMLHAKTLLVDAHLALVGSANVDMRSFDLNFEVGALVFDRALAADVARAIEHDLADCREVTPSDLRRLSLAALLAQGAAKLLSPVL